MDELTITLVASIMSVLTPFIKRGTEAFANEFGRSAANKVMGVLSSQRPIF